MTTAGNQFNQVAVGAPVMTADGEQLGTVKELRGTFFKVDAPMQPDYWLRMDAVRQGSTTEVWLGFTKDRLGEYQVTSPDEVDTEAGRMTDYRASDYPLDTTAEHETTARAAEMPQTETTGERTVRLNEERLQATKRPVEAGEVGIRKEVVTEQQTIDVPVTREEVVIERRPVSGEPASQEIREGEEIRIPVREEEVDVQKRTVAREEVRLGKRQVQETERVSDTVRREEAHVETEGDVDVRGTDDLRRGQAPDQR